MVEREKAVETLLAPVREALQKTHEQIARIEKERSESFGALRSSLESVALGQVTLQKTNDTTLTVRCLKKQAGAVMDVRSVRITPVGGDRPMQPELVAPEQLPAALKVSGTP